MSRVAVAVAVVAVAAAVSRVAGLRLERPFAVAVVRAVVQLLALAVVIEAVFEHAGMSAAFLGLMLCAAAWTTAGRWGRPTGGFLRAALAIGAGAGFVLGVVLALPVFDRTPQYVLPLGGLVIGGAMTAASVAGRRTTEDIADQIAVIEARVSLGAPARTALAPVVTRAAFTALIPALDQTRNVGLITLPGAFVGTLLAGAGALRAAQIQLTVLFMLLGAEALSAAAAALLVARSHIAVGERVVPTPGTKSPQ